MTSRLVAVLLFGACSGDTVDVLGPTSESGLEDEETDSTSDPTPFAPTLTTGTHTLEHDGLERSFNLYIPATLQAGAPLIFALHGYATSAQYVQDSAELDALAEQEGFVVVYPQGTRDHNGQYFFNVGYEVHADLAVDDMAFLKDLNDLLISDLQINPATVFVGGMSVGGDMAYRLACQADWVRAAAPIAGSLQESAIPLCKPSTAVPLMVVNGTADFLTWYYGDPLNLGGWGAYLPVEETVEHWVTHYGLTLEGTDDLPNIAPNDGSTVVRFRYETSASDTSVWFYKINGGGHDWPGVSGNRDFHASHEMWDFFSRYID